MRADANAKLGRPDKAIPDLEEATRLDPNHAAAYESLGIAHGASRGNCARPSTASTPPCASSPTASTR